MGCRGQESVNEISECFEPQGVFPPQKKILKRSDMAELRPSLLSSGQYQIRHI